MIVGCYSMDLYCDFGPHPIGYDFPHQFTGRTEAECFRNSKKRGWKIYPAQRKAKCPRCAGEALAKEAA